MAYRATIHARFLEVLAWLGKRRWITISKEGYEASADFDTLLIESRKLGRVFAQDVQFVISHVLPALNSGGIFYPLVSPQADTMFMASEMFAHGQKTVQLSEDWCKAFAKTDLTLAFSDYAQPYPTMVVEFDQAFAQRLSTRVNGDYPRFVAIHQNRQERVLLFEIGLHKMRLARRFLYNPMDQVEAVLRNWIVLPTPGMKPEIDISDRTIDLAYRISLNAMVAMTYGTDWKQLPPTNAHRQAGKNLNKRKPGNQKAVIRRARLRRGALPVVFQFKQEVEAFKYQQRGNSQSPGHAGARKKPHWRRGHWRLQATGVGRTGREPRWIRPILINKGAFKGDLKDTTTTYTT
jgi:hypothetical protein